jgi:hypothetical protein
MAMNISTSDTLVSKGSCRLFEHRRDRFAVTLDDKQ